MKRLWLIVLLAALPAAAQEPSPTPKVYVPVTRQVPLPSPISLPSPTLELPAEALKPLSANEASRIALARNQDVLVAATNVTAAEGRQEQQQSGLMPHLRLNANYSQSLLNGGSSNLAGAGLAGGAGGLGGTAGGVTGATGATGANSTANSAANSAALAGGGLGFAVTSWTVGGSLNQLLFDFGHTRSLVAQAEAQVDVAMNQMTATESNLVLDVKRTFYQALQNERLVGVQMANLANQQAHLNDAEGRFKSGLGLPADVTRADTAVTEAISNVTQARNDANLSKVSLCLLMGVDPRTPLSLTDSAEQEIEVPEVEKLFDMALERRPELAAAVHSIRAAQFGVDAAETTSAPSLSANLAYNKRGFGGFDFDTVFLTLSFAFEPYDGGLTAGRVKEAEAQLKAAEVTLDGTRRRVIADVATAYLDLKTAEQRMVAAEAAEFNARETVRLSEGRYKAGLGIFLDLLDAQAALVTAETNRVNSRAARSVARAALARAVGVALDVVRANRN